MMVYLEVLQPLVLWVLALVTGSILTFTVSGHVPEILHFLLVIVTFPFAG